MWSKRKTVRFVALTDQVDASVGTHTHHVWGLRGLKRGAGVVAVIKQSTAHGDMLVNRGRAAIFF
jgi:hypothetical protein